jgi:1-deoxy-D-xylulose-5-phosphate synthase
MAPADENECRQMLYTGFLHQGPAAVRYPRGRGPGKRVEASMTALPVGKAEAVMSGDTVAILAFGSTLAPAREVASRIGASLVNMRFVKPLDADLINEMARTHKLLVTVEDNAVAGGAGSGVNELILATGKSVQILNIGLPDRYIEHGSHEDCLAEAGLDMHGILEQVNCRLKDITGGRKTTGSDLKNPVSRSG